MRPLRVHARSELARAIDQTLHVADRETIQAGHEVDVPPDARKRPRIGDWPAGEKVWIVDAPELRQTCSDGWQAGKMAADYLTGLIHNRSVACDLKQSPSTPGKVYALCKVDGQDLSAAMAEAGMAWSYTPQTRDYTVQETNAMIGVFGVHAHDCMKAWEWRTRQAPPRS